MLEPLSPSRPLLEAAGEVMTAAFQNYQIFAYICPDPAKRRRLLLWLFPRLLRVFLQGGQQVYAIRAKADGPVTGVVIGAKPDARRGASEEATMWQYLRNGLLEAPFRFGPSTIVRLLSMDSAITADRTTLGRKNGPFWYIEYLCVSPTVQSQGLGSQSLQELLTLVLQENPGATIALSTCDPKNRPFYTRNGFTEVHNRPVHGVDNWWFLYRRQ